MHDSSFGKEIFILGASLSGRILAAEWEGFLPELYLATGIRPSHASQTFDYGTIGYIHIQPIISSFIVLDVWPDHEGAYLHICSCKPFNIDDVIALIKGKYKVVESFSRELRL